MFAAKIKVAVCLLLFATATNAGADPSPPPGCGFVCGTITPSKDPSVGVPFDDPESTLGPPWVSYEIAIHTNYGGSVPAFDVLIEGQLHQRWSDSNANGVFEATANGVDATTGDSHLLMPPDAFIGLAPTEDNTGNGSPLPDTPTSDYGVGATLYGAWTLRNPTGFTKLAYIVVPKGSPLEVSVKWAFPADPIGELTTDDFIWIPEPGTAVLGVFAFCAYALAARPPRRRP